MDLRILHSGSRARASRRKKDRAKVDHPRTTHLKPQTKNGNGKIKKDMGKWFEFHKCSPHNTHECCTSKSFVVELKALESYAGSESEPDLNKGKQIIDAEPSATVATTRV